jgi:hypothetical protein
LDSVALSITQPTHAEKNTAKPTMAARGSAITHHVQASRPKRDATALAHATNERA